LLLSWALTLSAGSALAQGLLPTEMDSIPEELTLVDGGEAFPAEPVIAEPAPAGSVIYSENNLDGFVMPVEGPEAAIVSSGTIADCGFWYAQGDAVFLQRTNFYNRELAFDSTTGSDRTLTLQRGQGFGSPFRVTLGRYLARDYENRDYMTEVVFFGLGFWDAGGSVQSVADNFLMSSIDPFIGGFNGSNVQSYSYQSSFNSYELNYRVRLRLPRDRMVLRPDGQWVRELHPGHLASILFGLRFHDLDEDFHYTSVSTVPALRSGDLLIRTSNNMYGVQTGGELVWRDDRWSLGVKGKAGAYLNSATQVSELNVVDVVLGNVSQTDSATREALAFLGELSVFARFQVTNNIAFRTAYESMYVNSVAVAPQQINFALAEPSVAIAGQEMYQGLSFSLDATW
jgi:hypothetical protein